MTARLHDLIGIACTDLDKDSTIVDIFVRTC
jgi:hypothetical protein